jgi:hypothetical protein
LLYHISITARNSRDESCDLYRLNWHDDIQAEDFSPERLATLINQVKETYLDSWPMRGVAAPKKAFIPVDVEVIAIPDADDDEYTDQRLRGVPAA